MRSLLLFLLFWPAAALSQDTPPDPGDCALSGDALPGWWSASERWVWDQVCAGLPANLAFADLDPLDDGDCTADDPLSVWPEARRLSARFALQLATDPDLHAALREPEVVIQCAVFEDTLKIEDKHVPIAFVLQDSRFARGASLINSHFGRALNLSGSVFERTRQTTQRLAFTAPSGVIGAQMALNLSGLRADAQVAFDAVTVNGQMAAFDMVAARNLSLQTARVSGMFAADRVQVGRSLFLNNGAEFVEVRLLSARIGSQVLAQGSSFIGTFSLEGAEVGGEVLLRDGGSYGEVRLLGADIGGQVQAEGSTFSGPFSADSATIGGNVYLNDGAHFNTVRFAGARIGGGLFAAGSTFSGLFLADSATIDGNVFLRNGSDFERVSFSDATVGQNIETSGSRFSGTFIAEGVRVGGGVYFRDHASFSNILLTGATIDGSLLLSGGDFSEEVDLTGVEIGGALVLNSFGSVARWGPDASLDLRNARIGALQAAMPLPDIPQAVHPWRRVDPAGGHAPLPVDLTNFSYDRLGSFGGEAGTDLSRVRPDRLIAWVAQSHAAWPGGDGYAPQPYMQLATTLRSMGAGAAAEEVDYARLQHRMDTRDARWQRELDALSRAVVGFGVYPERALVWMLGLVGLGVLVSYASPSFRGTGPFTRLWYSLNNALPLVPLSQEFEGYRHGGPGVVSNFFAFQKVAGFLLATVLVGALTLLGG